MLIPITGQVVRLIPSRFDDQKPRPSVLAAVAPDQAALQVLYELDNLTNDRVLAGQGLTYQPLQHIVNAAFMHASHSRFNRAIIGQGAWYAAARLSTAIQEVGHHLAARAIDQGLERTHTDYTAYISRAEDVFLDAQQDAGYLAALKKDADDYSYSQQLGAATRDDQRAGIHYHSVRATQPEQICLAILQPWAVRGVQRGRSLRLSYQATSGLQAAPLGEKT